MACRAEDETTPLVDPLQVLPPEIGVHILGLLSASDLCRASVVSRHWYQLTSVDRLRRRRRRYVNYMRHVWATQSQNLVADVAGSVMSLQSVGSGSTMSRGSLAVGSSCSSVNAITLDSSTATDADDGVFRQPALPRRRPLGDRKNLVTVTNGRVAEAWPPQRTPVATNYGERPASDSSLSVVGGPAVIEPPLSVNVTRAPRPKRAVDKQAKYRLRRL